MQPNGISKHNMVIADSAPTEFFDAKKCPKCGEIKNIIAFNKHFWCRLCANRVSREWYYQNLAKAKEQHENFKKNHPGYYQTEKIRELQRKLSKRWYEENKEARNKQQMEYYYKNKEKFMEAIHRRRARKTANGGSFTHKEFIQLCQSYNDTCLSCGKKEPEIKLTPDHVIPLVFRGPNTIQNLQPLCLKCNCSKGTKTIDYRGISHV